jgi:hypothetical protein
LRGAKDEREGEWRRAATQVLARESREWESAARPWEGGARETGEGKHGWKPRPGTGPEQNERQGMARRCHVRQDEGRFNGERKERGYDRTDEAQEEQRERRRSGGRVVDDSKHARCEQEAERPRKKGQRARGENAQTRHRRTGLSLNSTMVETDIDL